MSSSAPASTTTSAPASGSGSAPVANGSSSSSSSSSSPPYVRQTKEDQWGTEAFNNQYAAKRDKVYTHLPNPHLSALFPSSSSSSDSDSSSAPSCSSPNVHSFISSDTLSSLVSDRRHLHRHPELSFQEFNTAAFIAERLRSLKHVTVYEKVGRTGVVGIITGTGKNPHGEQTDTLKFNDEDAENPQCIALRADMDALPIPEAETERNAEYRSTAQGVAHSCGHDGHVSALLAVAAALVQQRDHFHGTVKLMFQPAEEGHGGARAMIADGVLSAGRFGPRVQQVYGLHLWNYLNVGVVAVKRGALMAASDYFHIDVYGRGGHGAVPETTRDALHASAHLVIQLNSIISRNISPLDSAVLTIGKMNGGMNYNVIADHVGITGTIRTFEESVQKTVHERVRNICNGISSSFEVNCAPDIRRGYPATVNNSNLGLKHIQEAASKVIGKEQLVEPRASCCAEDFSYFLNATPHGAFFFVGSSPVDVKDEKNIIAHHTSNFDIDEKCLPIAASIFLNVVMQILGCKNEQH